MNKHAEQDPADYIEPLNMDGLHGRMLHMKARNPGQKREILLVYGQHSSIERWWGLIQEMNRYGAVTVPDLPGFGGMDSLYKIGKRANFDDFADYLAAFVKLRYRGKRITLVGLSIGFVVATRMLQRHPELTKKVDLLVSVVGFAHHDDFLFSKRRQAFYKYGSWFFLHRPLDLFLSKVAFNPVILRKIYHRSLNARDKFADKTGDEFTQTMDMEMHLWKINDIRTWLGTNIEMFRLDNCQVRVNLPVWHVYAQQDRYFDEHLVEQHYRVIFSDYTSFKSGMSGHGPSVVASANEAAAMFPENLRAMLLKK